jgi:hypothetical protein
VITTLAPDWITVFHMHRQNFVHNSIYDIFFNLPIHSRKSRSQSYDFGIYNYNASVVLGESVFSRYKKIFFCFQNAPGYLGGCKFLQRWRCNLRS